MQMYSDVHGSLESARPVIVGKTTVYVHGNVRRETITDEITGETITVYVYDEIQYTRAEWEQVMAEGHEETANALCDMDIEIEDIKDAICEIDEILEGGMENE